MDLSYFFVSEFLFFLCVSVYPWLYCFPRADIMSEGLPHGCLQGLKLSPCLCSRIKPINIVSNSV